MAGGPTRGRIGGGERRRGLGPGDRPRGDAEPSEERGRVIPFVPRPGAPGPRSGRSAPPPATVVADLSHYEAGEEPDDYRHRVLTNIAALVVLTLLIGGGLWIAATMADQRKSQDCVLSGRPGCTPVPLPKTPPGP